MTGLTWHPGADGVMAAQAGETTIGVVYPQGWWSSSIIGIARPAPAPEAARAALEAAWADWMAQSGLAWAQP